MFELEEDWLHMSPGEIETDERGVLRAGRPVPPGRYYRIDVPWGGIIALDAEGWLPASFDGKVALYVRINGPYLPIPAPNEWKPIGSVA